MTDPTREALIEALHALYCDEDACKSVDRSALHGSFYRERTDAILAQPAMTAIKAVVDAAVARHAHELNEPTQTEDWLAFGMVLYDAENKAVDALLAEDSDA